MAELPIGYGMKTSIGALGLEDIGRKTNTITTGDIFGTNNNNITGH
tara:strand:+ start:540 stop:677 length:138 start_codon:yes stop_codon:yes gene_type:complete